MNTTLITAFVLSLIIHSVIVLLGPQIRPPQIKEFSKNSVDVELVKREVPIPDALRPKPLPEVPQPVPLDLDRLLVKQGDPLGEAKLGLKIKPSVSNIKNIPKSPLISGLPKLELPRPATSLDSFALRRKVSSLSPEEIALPIKNPEYGSGLTEKKVFSGNPKMFLNLKRELSLLALEKQKKVYRQKIRGPVATRRVIFRPPPPKVKILETSEDIELRFWVLADGTVGRILPVLKGSAYLDGIAVNHMKRWRFNPLHPDEKKQEEWGLILYRFRVK